MTQVLSHNFKSSDKSMVVLSVVMLRTSTDISTGFKVLPSLLFVMIK